MRDYREGRVKVTDKIRGAIFELIIKEKDIERKKKYPAKWYREEVARELKLADKDNPSLRSYESVLQPIRKALQVDNPQNKPWSTATLDNNYPIPPEALPAVLKVWKLCIEKGQGFTIREAKWAARLSGLLGDIKQLSYKASQYARAELLYQLIDRPFDSTALDRMLMGLPVGLNADIESFLPLLAEQEDGIDQIRDLKQGKRKKLTIRPFG